MYWFDNHSFNLWNFLTMVKISWFPEPFCVISIFTTNVPILRLHGRQSIIWSDYKEKKQCVKSVLTHDFMPFKSVLFCLLLMYSVVLNCSLLCYKQQVIRKKRLITSSKISFLLTHFRVNQSGHLMMQRHANVAARRIRSFQSYSNAQTFTDQVQTYADTINILVWCSAFIDGLSFSGFNLTAFVMTIFYYICIMLGKFTHKGIQNCVLVLWLGYRIKVWCKRLF